MKLTKYKISLISLALVLLMALSAFFGLQFMTASAAGTTSGENAFKKSGDNVSLVAAKRTVSSTSASAGTEDNYYLTCRFVNGKESEDNQSYVYYNNDLAYSWYEKGEDDKGVNKFFNMELGFDDTNFEKFVITFESQQYVKTKDSKTLNYVMFFPVEGNKDQVYVLVTDNKDAGIDDIENLEVSKLGANHIRIEFVGRDKEDSGAYEVKIYNANRSSVLNEDVAETATILTAFKNVGGNYSKKSTGSTTVYPLIFKANFKKDAAESASTALVLYSINGQELNSSSGSSIAETNYYTLNSIKDNKPPVLCLDNDFKFFKQGAKVNFDYAVIDVLRTSISANKKINYYVLNKNQKNVAEDYDYLDKDLFKEASDSDLFETDYDAYLPTATDLAGTNFHPIYKENNVKNTEDNLYADMLVKVFVNIYDTSSDSYKEEANVYLDWYLSDKNTVKINGVPFIAVAEDKLGVKFNYDNKDDESWKNIVKAYQEKVDEAAKDLSAGSSNYFYLPLAESLFADNSTSYIDLKLSIYYYGQEQQNNSNLAASNLSINVTKQGAYTFTVYATDASGNKMYYRDEKGEVVEFASSEIWDMFKDKDKKDYLPWFTFDVKYTGVKFDEEEHGMQATGYVGASYTSASFKVNGVDYSTVYRLFYFNRDVYYKDTGKTFSYEDFLAQKDDLFKNNREYFTEIIAKDKMEETDEEYEKFADYGWSNSSTSFTPQAAGYYYMLAEAKDALYEAEPVTCSLAVVVSEASKSLKGESDWLKNNLTSVILLAVAAVALIGIVLLLVIKPKNKEDIDVRFKEKKKNKKSK